MFIVKMGDEEHGRFDMRDDAVRYILDHPNDDLELIFEGRRTSLNPPCCGGYRCTGEAFLTGVDACHERLPDDWNGLCPYQE